MSEPPEGSLTLRNPKLVLVSILPVGTFSINNPLLTPDPDVSSSGLSMCHAEGRWSGNNTCEDVTRSGHGALETGPPQSPHADSALG